MAETKLSASNLIMPYFVIEGRSKKEPISSMPGVYRYTVDKLIEDIKEVQALGIKAILLFGVTDKKDDKASQAYSPEGPVARAIRKIKEEIKDLVIMTDVCLCGYTTHGHCGVVRGEVIDNDRTLSLLVRISLSQAEAGSDFVAPSSMMDGQVKAIREGLDKNSFKEVGIVAYGAKFSSHFYGPFREALGSFPRFGHRKSYQMDFRNSAEALREIKQDIEEGADMVMVKPALAYLDIIRRVKENFNHPLVAYNVSGEYSLVKFYSQRLGGRDRGKLENELALEILTAIKRAGADMIITYHAREIARYLR